MTIAKPARTSEILPNDTVPRSAIPSVDEVAVMSHIAAGKILDNRSLGSNNVQAGSQAVSDRRRGITRLNFADEGNAGCSTRILNEEGFTEVNRCIREPTAARAEILRNGRRPRVTRPLVDQRVGLSISHHAGVGDVVVAV